MSRRVIVVDTETGGLGPGAPILEVAAVDLESGAELYFVPHADVTSAEPEALAINRYFERRLFADMLTAPATAVKYRELANMLDANTLAGSNPAFDAGLLQWVPTAVTPTSPVPAPPMGQIWHHRLLDLSAYAAGALGLPPGELPGLAKVCELLGVDNEGEHSALGDARATAECFRRLECKYRNFRYGTYTYSVEGLA